VSIYKRGRFWHFDFRFDGVRYQGSTRQTSKREAEQVLSALKTDLARRRVNLPAKSVKFREVSDRYEQLSRTDSRPSYVVEKYHIRKHLLPFFGEILLHALNREVCERYKRRRLKGGVSKATVNRELSTLKSILKYASECGVAPEGLGRNARLFSGVENREKRPLKVDEFGRLVEVCASLEFQVTAPYLFPLVVVGAFAGLRPSELMRLSKEDVDLEIGIIWVRKSKIPSGIRYVPLKKEAWEVLRYWLPRTKGKWVFPSPKMPGAHIKDFGKAFDKAVKQAGLQGITPDCLRHTFATKTKRHVRRLSDLREMMGHSSDRHTMPYLHEELEDKRAAVEALPVPANFTTVLEKWKEEPRQDTRQVRDSQGVEMVGPWGLEPQTSTVSR